MKTTIKTLFIAFLLLKSTFIFAEDPVEPGPDPGTVPIDNWIVPLIALVIVVLFLYFKKKQKQTAK